ncbi:MAG TPA: hypothetical protein VJT49_27940 [Amycolatopsis sp.]|uniref:hypothetical protein n=1 Tax=Amycolatopsis sp. TaxID=37632 RepID=UPI002B4612F3|nr:hypothetical protein [Amycolatopsis sp.]HKS48872.1 hypothetical protein [Amycolatopsis sp.]
MTAATPSDIARRLVAEFLLPPGDEILEVRAGTAATLVATSRTGWRVEPVPEIGTTPVGDGYRLFGVQKATTDTGDPVEGFAVLPDGRAFRMGDPAQLRAFYREVTPRLAPLEAAFLVALFVAPQPAPRFLVTDDTPGPPQVVADAPSRSRVTLHTYTWQFPDETELRVYERWEVRQDDEIEWDRDDLGALTP